MIKFKDVTVIYDKDIVGLDNVSFKIEDGEFVFLVGKTGAGKSSAIKLLTGEIHYLWGQPCRLLVEETTGRGSAVFV